LDNTSSRCVDSLGDPVGELDKKYYNPFPFLKTAALQNNTQFKLSLFANCYFTQKSELEVEVS